MDTTGGVYVLGSGGHAKVVVQALQALGHTVVAVFDDARGNGTGEWNGLPVIRPLAQVQTYERRPSVVAIGDNAARQSIVSELNVDWITIVHPRGFVDPTVRLGEGVVVLAGAVVQADASIGSHAIINTSASVDHDCDIGKFVHIAPGARLAGSVVVGNNTLIGIGAVVLPGIRIGQGVVVGAGAVVTRDVPADVVVMGMPARITHHRDST